MQYSLVDAFLMAGELAEKVRENIMNIYMEEL